MAIKLDKLISVALSMTFIWSVAKEIIPQRAGRH